MWHMSTDNKIVSNSFREIIIATYQIECDTITNSLQYYEHKNIIETTLIFAISHKPQTQTNSITKF